MQTLSVFNFRIRFRQPEARVAVAGTEPCFFYPCLKTRSQKQQKLAWNTKLHHRKARVHPRRARVHPRKAKVHHRKARVHPRKARVHPRKARVHHRKCKPYQFSVQFSYQISAARGAGSRVFSNPVRKNNPKINRNWPGTEAVRQKCISEAWKMQTLSVQCSIFVSDFGSPRRREPCFF